jgi:hypothetical protein
MTQTDIENIQQRNARVELDKAWETSWTRRLIIAIITYVVAGIWLIIINVDLPWLSALVPTGGFVLSTLSMTFIKRSWIKKHIKKYE